MSAPTVRVDRQAGEAVFRKLGEGVWVVDASVVYISRPVEISLPVRMTIMTMAPASKELLVYSPLPLSAQESAECAAAYVPKAQVDRLGEVRCIVAPNAMHHMYASHWIDAYPAAVSCAVPALLTKRPDVSWTYGFGSQHCQTFFAERAPAIRVFRVDGIDTLDEVVMYHEPSRILVACDLAFNPDFSKISSAPIRWYLRLTLPRPMCLTSPFRFLIKDSRKALESMDAIMALDFDGIVVSHGEVVESGGKAMLSAGTWQFLKDLAHRSEAKSPWTSVKVSIAFIAAAAVAVAALYQRSK
mmetsp:Transcript_9983/g.26617  ORF Transcript_9983/g.26617 Transcript_9983/m.26617 type:complete len:300 (+) Transcript_9983:55-954(+)|eukprot:CAMPEP_0185830900 /NCGR_PEP_ID=MMETSP1353-20130828/1149_1 /TAXON_ID=1077150 /ORGANISM="Erythrolobus australicus, Strain CCMP3124" /LENGTH=299 /DNA_ID=CAMNT_0028528893 /DNA_START=33 /DNA_END=932 /DNA_ORIENTATION=+